MRPIVGIDDDFNLYAYVGNDPVNGIDPTGTETAFITTYSACYMTGGSNCEAIAEPYYEMGRAFPFSGAAEQLDQSNYLAAGVLGALDVGTGGRGRIVSSVLGKSLERTVGRIANRLNVINQRHIQAALREARGEVVARRPDGKPFDHIGELREAAAGLKNDVLRVKDLIGSGKLDDDARDAAQKALSQGSKLLDKAQNVLGKVEKHKIILSDRDSNMLVDIEKRFRSGAITKADCEALKEIIVASDDESTLEAAIYIYGRSCSFDQDVLEVCKRYLVDQPVPGLTAVCMRTALDYWDLWEQYPEVLAGYLNIDLYDEWYDEVIFACRFCSKLNAEQATAAFASRLTTLLDAAKREGRSELVELANAESNSRSHERDRPTH